MVSRFSDSTASSTLVPTEIVPAEIVPAKISNQAAQTAVTQTTAKPLPNISTAIASPVQRQYADILSCMAKHQLQAPILGVVWDSSSSNSTLQENTGNSTLQDNTGNSTLQDNTGNSTLCNGAFLQPTQDSTQYGFDQVARFLPYSLLVGNCSDTDKLIKDRRRGHRSVEPRQSALSLLYSCYGEDTFEMADLAPTRSFTASQLAVLRGTLAQQKEVLTDFSVDQLFDGIASLLDLHHYSCFAGQATRTLEFAATQSSVRAAYPFVVTDARPALIDWREMIKAVVEDCHSAVMTPVIAAKFYNTLVEIIVEIAHRTNNSQIVLSGSCFQNKALIERAIRRLSVEGFTPYWT